MSAPTDDRELVMRAKNGSEEAFSALVDKYYLRVHRVAVRIVRDVDEADEVVQEVFARAVTHLNRFDSRASFYTWLISITRNAAFDALRSMQRRGRFKSSEDGMDRYDAEGFGDPVRSTSDQEAAERVVKALGRLSARDRSLLVLREYEDLQYEEIARVLGCSVGTVESGIHRARKKLRMLLVELDPDAQLAR